MVAPPSPRLSRKLEELSVRLSPKTEKHIAALFPASVRSEVAELLLHRCGNNLPFLEKCDEFQLERFRFAVLKLSRGDIAELQEAVKLANQDWRDLLVSAGFANDVEAHKRWYPDSPERREMAESTSPAPVRASDDWLTVCAISVLAGMLGNVVHEGLGHAATALLTGAKSGVLSTVAWSSAQDSRLVAAGGTLANLAAGLAFWFALRSAKSASVRWRYLLLAFAAFNLFDGTGYFLFSGFTDFGDWAVVIAGLPAHWFWRVLLVVLGISSYFAAALLVGRGLVRYVGVSRNDQRRLRKLTYLPYFTSILLASAAGLLNPLGLSLMWQSALPATAGGLSGFLWLRYYIPKETVPERPSDGIGRNYASIALAIALAIPFIFVLGRGITLDR
jgi:hypothetical protein